MALGGGTANYLTNEMINKVKDNLVRTGYQVDRLNTKSNGNGSDITSSYLINSDLTAYAIWKDTSAHSADFTTIISHIYRRKSDNGNGNNGTPTGNITTTTHNFTSPTQTLGQVFYYYYDELTCTILATNLTPIVGKNITAVDLKFTGSIPEGECCNIYASVSTSASVTAPSDRNSMLNVFNGYVEELDSNSHIMHIEFDEPFTYPRK